MPHARTSPDNSVYLWGLLSPGEASTITICSEQYISPVSPGAVQRAILVHLCAPPPKKKITHSNTHICTYTHKKTRRGALVRCKPCGEVALIEGFVSLPEGQEQHSQKQPQINTAHICQGVIKFPHSLDVTHPIHTQIYMTAHMLSHTNALKWTLNAQMGADRKYRKHEKFKAWEKGRREVLRLPYSVKCSWLTLKAHPLMQTETFSWERPILRLHVTSALKCFVQFDHRFKATVAQRHKDWPKKVDMYSAPFWMQPAPTAGEP